ncbi:hypothetical protein DFJ73DRAFT_765142 [Zopfochytrium polystomum]|nr:hypothetical protein DFJ73DRAFT_765142 [Zopfochytrium polystomum]
MNEEEGKMIVGANFQTLHAPWILTQAPALEARNVKPPLNQAHLDLLHVLSGMGVRISYSTLPVALRTIPVENRSRQNVGLDGWVWGSSTTCGGNLAGCCRKCNDKAAVMQQQKSSLTLTGTLSMSSTFWTPLSPLPLKIPKLTKSTNTLRQAGAFQIGAISFHENKPGESPFGMIQILCWAIGKPKPETEVVCGSVQYQAAAAHPGLELYASGAYSSPAVVEEGKQFLGYRGPSVAKPASLTPLLQSLP